MSTWLRSTCPHDCPSACGLLVERRDDGRLGKVKGDPDHGYTRGVICAKVARYRERAGHPGRLRAPLLRVGARGVGRDAYAEIAWEEALDRLVDGLRGAERAHGGDAIWPYQYAGTMGLVQRHALNRLRHLAGWAGQAETICTGLSTPGIVAGSGSRRGVDPREMVDAELIVLWGCNAVHTQVNVMHYVAQARRRGAALVVVDPYRNATAARADLHLMIAPGSDAALACAVMQVLLEEGLADREYLRQYTDFDDQVEAHLAARGPRWAAALTGLEADQIRAFARRYGATRRSFIRLGYGLSRSRNGAMSMHAVHSLPAFTGAWSVHGGGALQGTGVHLFDQSVLQCSDRRDPARRVLDMSRIGPILTGEAAEMRGAPPVAAMLIQNTNPMVVAPDSARVHAGLARPDLFLAVHEQFMTETAAMADLVLPATCFLEHEDLYLANGHTYLGLGPALFEPPGVARPNSWLVQQVARRLGIDDPAVDGDDTAFIERLLGASGLPPRAAFEHGVRLDCALPPARAHFRDGFDHPDGRFHLRANWAALGDRAGRLPALPDHVALVDAADEERPWRLVTAPARWFLNSSFTEPEDNRRRQRRPELLIHPAALRAIGARDGQRLRLGNAQGSLVLPAREFDGLQRGVVVVESLWPNAAFEEGVGINLLTSADSPPPAGGAAFHDTAVWIRPA